MARSSSAEGAAGNDLQIGGRGEFQITLLHRERIRAHAPYLQQGIPLRRLEQFEQAKVFLRLEDRQCFRGEIRRDDDLAENLRDGRRTTRVQDAVHGDDAAERRLLVGGERPFPRRMQRGLPRRKGSYA
jgi:hypothetical protein